tara:strand:- start:403 stop:669 length:267 start_codon:yes stop_codon:yes gene_type:complete
MAKFNFSVFTHSGNVINKDVEFLRFSSTSGDVGIEYNHTASLLQCKSGDLLIKVDQKDELYQLNDGFVHVEPDQVVLFTDYLEFKNSK